MGLMKVDGVLLHPEKHNEKDLRSFSSYINFHPNGNIQCVSPLTFCVCEASQCCDSE